MQNNIPVNVFNILKEIIKTKLSPVMDRRISFFSGQSSIYWSIFKKQKIAEWSEITASKITRHGAYKQLNLKRYINDSTRYISDSLFLLEGLYDGGNHTRISK